MNRKRDLSSPDFWEIFDEARKEITSSEGDEMQDAWADDDPCNFGRKVMDHMNAIFDAEDEHETAYQEGL